MNGVDMLLNQKPRGFLILDFGSQLTQLIARRLRELGHYSEIVPFSSSLETISLAQPSGIILSGGPSSVYDPGAPSVDVEELSKIAPVMGICYGMQLIAHALGGEVKTSPVREYGFERVFWDGKAVPWGQQQNVWMSHGDVVQIVPVGFEILARSSKGLIAAIQNTHRKIFAVQFHPEVAHTENGNILLRHFAEGICGAKADWDTPTILQAIRQRVLDIVGEQDRVLCALSGGVDSSVVATLLTQVLGADRVFCIFVDNGLLRKNEFQEVLMNYKKLGLNVQGVDASSEFLSALSGVSDPEEKRKIIGRVFIETFEKQLPELGRVDFLAQGTLYPDVIESVSAFGGPSHVIKSHHNVGGLPDKMKLKLLEPVRELFKDEVRRLGQQIGVPYEMVQRHPFPGPGLAIRVLGEVNRERLQILQKADAIFIQILKDKNLYHKIWQAFCVLLPVKTVGVQGDGRTYAYVLSLRAVTSVDGMTADWFPFEFETLREISNQITNQIKEINRVVYDVTSKPPATIEWE